MPPPQWYAHYIYMAEEKKGGGGKTPPIGPYGDFFQCLGSNDPRTGRNRLISYTMIVLGYLSPILVILKIFDSYHAVTSSWKLADFGILSLFGPFSGKGRQNRIFQGSDFWPKYGSKSSNIGRKIDFLDFLVTLCYF